MSLYMYVCFIAYLVFSTLCILVQEFKEIMEDC